MLLIDGHTTHSWVIVNPFLGYHSDTVPNMGDTMQPSDNAQEILARNLDRLMKASQGAYTSAPALERATALHGTKIGRSTISRVLNASTPVNLEYIEVLASVFRKKPWELLHCDLGDMSHERESVDLQTAIDLLAETLEQFPEEQRSAIGERLMTLAKAPDSTRTRLSLVNALQSSRLGGLDPKGDGTDQAAA